MKFFGLVITAICERAVYYAVLCREVFKAVKPWLSYSAACRRELENRFGFSVPLVKTTWPRAIVARALYYAMLCRDLAKALKAHWLSFPEACRRDQAEAPDSALGGNSPSRL